MVLKKRILLLPCNNGLGHIERCSILSNKLSKKYHCTIIISKKKLNKFKLHKNVKIKYFNLDSNLQKKKIKLSKIFIKYLKKFELIISDNLIDPALYYDKVFLISNFFWHDIHEQYYLKKKIISKLKNKKIKLFRNYLIKYKNYKYSIPIPFFGNFIDKFNDNRENILISLGTANIKNKSKVYNLIYNSIISLSNFDKAKLCYVDKDLYDFLIKKIDNKNIKYKIRVANYSKKMFQTISVAIIKSGMGIIKNCLKNSIIILLININFGKEFENNDACLLKKKLAFKKKNIFLILKKSFELVCDKKKQYNYYKKCKRLKWNGENLISNKVDRYFKNC